MTASARPLLAMTGREALLAAVLVVTAVLVCLLAWRGMSWTKPHPSHQDQPAAHDLPRSATLMGRRIPPAEQPQEPQEPQEPHEPNDGGESAP